MTILEYYQEKQKDPVWYNAYTSLRKNGKGKIFSFINTNFRKLSSIFSQLEAFKSKDGKKRSEWDTMDCGQEQDKHRVVNLRNFGLIVVKDDRYFITEKGKEVLRINNNNNLSVKNKLSDKDKWLLLFMLIIDYRTDEEKLDILRTVARLSEKLSKCGLERNEFLKILAKASRTREKEDFFKTDAFWLLTFFTDEDFIELYLKSSESDKNELFNWVIFCMKEKRNDDCVAYKYRSGGNYTISTLEDDINITLCVLALNAIQDDSWERYIELLCQFYPSTDFGRINNFMKENIDIYNKNYKEIYNIFLKISNRR